MWTFSPASYGEESARVLCQLLIQSQKIHLNWLDRIKLSHLDQYQITSPWQRSYDVTDEPNNYIFLPARVPVPSRQQLQRQWKKNFETLEPFQRKTRSIKRADSVEECLERIEKTNLNVPAYWKALKKFQKDQAALQPQLEALALQAEIRQLSRPLKERWKIYPYSHLEEIKEILRDGTTHNVILVAHATSTGKLVDSDGHHFPLGFFEGLSRSLFSLTLYSCFAKEVVKTYQVDQALTLESFYPKRPIYFVKEVEDYDKLALAPLPRLSSFIRKVDRAIRRELPGNRLEPQSQMGRWCQIQIETPLKESEQVTLTIDRKFIGKASARKSLLRYPCDWVRPDSVLFLRPIGVRALPEVDLLQLSFSDPAVSATHQRFFRNEQWVGQRVTFQ